MSEEFYQITHERLAELTAAEAELATLRAHNAALVEALENTTQAFQDELDRRGVTEDLDEEELIDWLGKDDGRKAIGLLIRLRQARNALAQVAK